MINAIYESMTINAPEPQIGMGATITHWTDRDAGTVVAWDGKVICVQQDHAKRIDDNGMSDAQQYEYTPNPHGQEYYFRRNKHNVWVHVRLNEKTGRWVNARGPGLIVGFRDEHYDYSF